MRVLLDTHALLWFLVGDKQKLSTSALDNITAKENEVCVSIASLWEIAIKVNIGKLKIHTDFPKLEKLIDVNVFDIVPLKYSHLIEYLNLQLIHRDPFDRILVAQSIQEGFQIITKDPNLSQYPIKTIW